MQNQYNVYIGGSTMAVIGELIRKEDGMLSFGNYELASKTKLSDFEFMGDLYKVKTYKDITKLEKNGLFVYESVPGTSVHNFSATVEEVNFQVEGFTDSQVTLELEAETEYQVTIGGQDAGVIKTNLGGKLVLSVELDEGKTLDIKINKR